MQASGLPSNRPDPDPFPNRACRGHDPDIFFPEDDRNSGPAKDICADCPHRTPCGEHALATRERYGVWGGLSEQERLVILDRIDWVTGHKSRRNTANERLRNGRVR